MNYKSLVKNIDNLLAHRTNSKEESLLEHINNTNYAFNLIDAKYSVLDKLSVSLSKLEFSNKNTKFKLSKEAKLLIKDMFKNAITLHDIGKINPKFQIDRMENNLISQNCSIKNTYLNKMNTYHSSLSSILYIDVFLKNIYTFKDIKEKNILIYFLLIFANTIYCHHSKLDNLENNMSENNIEKILKIIDETNNQYILFYEHKITVKKEIGRVIEGIKNYQFDTFPIYIWSKLLYSILCSCDFIATYCFYTGTAINTFKLNSVSDVEALKNVFGNTDIYKGIESYSLDKNYFKDNNLPLINELRSDILLECKANLKSNLDKRIFNIESPTGSGKTFNSISCSLELLKSNSKMFYVFPVNSIATQTKQVLKELFENNLDVQEVNSTSKIPINKQNCIDYNKVLLDYQLLNYECVVTSNVSLFNLLFSPDRISSMGLFSLFDGVIVLDEIQNYKNSIWREIIEMLYKYSEIMGFKLIVMSATLPNLEELIGYETNYFIDLVSNPTMYYKNELFKNRVTIDTKLLKEAVTFETLYKLITDEVNKRNKSLNSKTKFLIEFISKKTAIEFYRYILSKNLEDDYDIYELDGDDNHMNKSQIINTVQKENLDKNILLITTQVIEAGIDIDFDLGAKDAVFPDLDEQFLGRINRSCLKLHCKAFFFNLDNEFKIYSGDYRNGSNIYNELYLNLLINKDFKPMYSKVFRKINLLKNKRGNSFFDLFKDIYLKKLEYKSVANALELISTESFEVFIPQVIDGINGIDIWNDFRELLDNKNICYAEKAVKIKNSRESLSNFTYTIYGKGLLGEEPLSNIYYLSNGISCIENNKLNQGLLKKLYEVYT